MIEIKNYKTDIASKSLLASFDIVFREWGMVIRECKLFEKNDKRWIMMPSKSHKNADGTWATPILYLDFIDKKLFYKVQDLVLQEIKNLKDDRSVHNVNFTSPDPKYGRVILGPTMDE